MLAIQAASGKGPLATQSSRSRRVSRTAGVGHEEQLPPLGLSARYLIRQETSAGAQRNGRCAPITDLPRRLPCHSRADSVWRSNLTLWGGSALVPDPSRPTLSVASNRINFRMSFYLANPTARLIIDKLTLIIAVGYSGRETGADGLSPEHELEACWPSSAGCAVAPRGASSGERSTAATRANSLRHPVCLFAPCPPRPARPSIGSRGYA